MVKLRIVTEEEIVNRTPKSMLWRKRIRKSAHLGLFALVGMPLYLVTGSLIKSVVIIFIFGSADEIHQYFVSGRGAQIMDVLIDTLGGVVGIFFAKTINYVK